MQQNSRETYPYQTEEKEIDLRKLAKSLKERRRFIFSFTGIVTLLTILYVLSLPPLPPSPINYKVTTSFIKPSQSSVMDLNRLPFQTETAESIFTGFLNKLSTTEFQEKVFYENDYPTVLNASDFLSSISISAPATGVRLIENPYSISMHGSDSEIISRFLNQLVASANSETVNDLSKIVKQKIDIRLDEISEERELLLVGAQRDRLSQIERIKEKDDQKLRELNNLIDAARYKAKENRLNHMIILTSAAKLASSLGVTEHNLDQISLQEENFNLNIALGEENLPDWYLYGEKALIERIKLLESRISDDPFIPELVTLQNQINEIQENNLLKTLEKREDDTPFISRINALDIEKIRLESFNIEQDGINAMILNQAAFASQYSNKNKQIIVLAIFGSFILSIILALMMNLFKEDEV